MSTVRSRGIGFRQDPDNLDFDDIQELVLQIIEEEDIDYDNLSEEDLELIAIRLGEEIYGEENAASIQFASCIWNRWGEAFSSGFLDVTVGQTSILEEFIFRANGCNGAVNAQALFLIGDVRPERIPDFQRRVREIQQE